MSLEVPPEGDGDEGVETSFVGHIPRFKDILRDGLSFGFLHRDEEQDEHVSFEVNLKPWTIQ